MIRHSIFHQRTFVTGMETIWNNKGVALDNLGKYQEAIECYDKAIQINHKFPLFLVNRGIALRKLERYDKAILCLDEFIRLNPTASAMWDNKGNLLNIIGRYEEAIECYDKSLSSKQQWSR
jgi:tetratricopeptide (TPR) repeat protein